MIETSPTPACALAAAWMAGPRPRPTRDPNDLHAAMPYRNLTVFSGCKQPPFVDTRCPPKSPLRGHLLHAPFVV